MFPVKMCGTNEGCLFFLKSASVTIFLKSISVILEKQASIIIKITISIPVTPYIPPNNRVRFANTKPKGLKTDKSASLHRPALWGVYIRTSHPLKQHHPVGFTKALGRAFTSILIHLHLTAAEVFLVQVSLQGRVFQPPANPPCSKIKMICSTERFGT